MCNKQITNSKLVFKGYLWVNLPVMAIILLTWYLLLVFFNLKHFINVFISVSLGWLYWEFAVKKWIKWALTNNVNEDKLLKIGKLSLLLWNNKQIEEVKKKYNL